MRTPARHRIAVVATMLVASGLLPFALTAEAATTYSASLRTAVRQLPVKAEDATRYDRAFFGGSNWRDVDRDCMDTRHEVLATEGAGERLSQSRCTVVSGTWRSPYDLRTYTSPRDLQIDHMIPLSEAWDSGARTWTYATRLAFANDLGSSASLNAMPSGLNQSKGDRGPEAWMPPASRCYYVLQWTIVKHRWRLNIDPVERATLVRWADNCSATYKVTVARAR